MENENVNTKAIKQLSTWDMGDTVYKQDGWDRITLPEPTAENMMLFMKKINELTAEVNKLSECLIIARQ